VFTQAEQRNLAGALALAGVAACQQHGVVRPSTPAVASGPAPVAQRVPAQPAPAPAPEPRASPALAEQLASLEPTLRQALGPAGLEKLAVAASVCAAAVQRDGNAVRVGCRSCPPFDAAHGPDGRIAVLDATNATNAELFELETMVTGSFSKAGAKQAAAVFNGCEPHSDNWGGTLLVEWQGKTWSALSYRSGLHPLSCLPFPKPGAHDVLVCSWASTHQGHTAWMLDVYDFTRGSDEKPELGWDRLLTLQDDSAASCSDDGDGRVSVASLDELRLARAGSLPPRVLVTASYGEQRKTPRYRAACEASREDGGESVRLGESVPAAKHELEFAWSGERLVPNRRTRAFIERVSVE
jgi:hypothetical protein